MLNMMSNLGSSVSYPVPHLEKNVIAVESCWVLTILKHQVIFETIEKYPILLTAVTRISFN